MGVLKAWDPTLQRWVAGGVAPTSATIGPVRRLYSVPGAATWVKPANLAYLEVEVVGGGGGGGGGTASPVPPYAASPAGGGGGGYAKRVYPAEMLPASCSIVVGAGGLGGYTWSNPGAAGNQSSFSGSGFTTLYGNGGAGGTQNGQGTWAFIPGSAGGGCGGGDIAIPGGDSGQGWVIPKSDGNGSPTGANFSGASALAPGKAPTGNGNGATGNFPGGGGGGSVLWTEMHSAGGTGGGGCVIVTEYYLQPPLMGPRGPVGPPGSASVTSGLVFPTVAVPSTDPNTLDDYREGDWTPGYAGASGGIGSMGAYNNGVYTKIGRLVYLQGSVYGSRGTCNGGLRITGLPFPIRSGASRHPSFTIGYFNAFLGFSAGYWPMLYSDPDTSHINFMFNYGNGTMGAVSMDSLPVAPTAAHMLFSGFYHTDA